MGAPACAPRAPLANPNTQTSGSLSAHVKREPGRPPLGFFVTERPAGALTALLMTPGSTPEAVAIAALVETRLERLELTPRMTVRADSVEATLLVAGPEETARAMAALRLAVTRPVDVQDEPALRRATERTTQLAQATPQAPRLLMPARCRGDAQASATSEPPRIVATLAELERVRRATATLQRASLGVVGTARAVEAARGVLLEGSAWPAEASAPFTLSTLDPATSTSAATSSRAHSLRLHVSLEARSGSSAAHAAELLARPSGPLARLAAREGGKVVRVAGVPHLDAGCVDVELALPLAFPPERAGRLVARAERLARDAEAIPPTGAQAERPAEAAEAAKQAALWAAADAPRKGVLHAYLSTFPVLELTPGSTAVTQAPAARVRAASVGETWVLIASPCGAADESNDDAGFGAVAMMAAAAAAPVTDGASVEPWITPTAIGLVAHGAPRTGESTRSTRERLATLAASALAAPAPRRALDLARARALASVSTSPARALAAAAEALLPGRVALTMPGGTATSLAQASHESLRERAVALAEGPLQVSVITPIFDAAATTEVIATLEPFALGPLATRSASSGCRGLPPPPVITASRALVERPHPGDGSEVVLIFPAPESADAALESGAALLAEGGLAAELGARATDVTAEVLPLAASRALLVRFRTQGGAKGAREALLAARTFLARPPSEPTLARWTHLAAQRTPQAEPRALLGRRGNGSTAALAPITAATLRATATALFASGGLAAIVGRAP